MNTESSASIQDSQAQFSNHDSQYLISQKQRITSNEEFDRLLQEPVPRLRLFNGQQATIRSSAFSCPTLTGSGSPLMSPISPGLVSISLVPSLFRPVPSHSPTTPADVNGDRVPKKRASKKAPSRKKHCAKKIMTQPVQVSDDDDEEGRGPQRWTDPKVQQLIAFRSEMDGDFERNAKKQGVHMWDKLQAQMVVGCDNFTKSDDACRNKWKVIYKQYCVDKRLLNISGEGRKVTCKFFDEIDQDFNNAANVRKFVHSDARGNENPCPLEINEDNSSVGPIVPGTLPQEKTSTTVKGPKKSHGEVMSGYMGDMVSQTTNISLEIKKTTTVVENITNQFQRLVDKL